MIRKSVGAALLLSAAAFLPLPVLASEQTVRFASIDEDLTGGPPTQLSALLVTPDGVGPFPAIVLAHGCDGLYRPNGTTLSATYIWWGRRFAEEGYAALLVDSFRPRGRTQVCVNEPDKRTITPAKDRARDVQAARRYLSTLPTILPDRIGLMGWSNGGSTVLSASSIGAPGHSRNSNFRATIAFYPGCYGALRDTTWAPATPILILIGLADDWTPAVHCQSLVDRSANQPTPITMHGYPDAHHAFDAPNLALRVRTGVNTKSGTATIGTNHEARDDAIQRTLAFFAEALKR